MDEFDWSRNFKAVSRRFWDSLRACWRIRVDPGRKLDHRHEVPGRPDELTNQTTFTQILAQQTFQLDDTCRNFVATADDSVKFTSVLGDLLGKSSETGTFRFTGTRKGWPISAWSEAISRWSRTTSLARCRSSLDVFEEFPGRFKFITTGIERSKDSFGAARAFAVQGRTKAKLFEWRVDQRKGRLLKSERSAACSVSFDATWQVEQPVPIAIYAYQHYHQIRYPLRSARSPSIVMAVSPRDLIWAKGDHDQDRGLKRLSRKLIQKYLMFRGKTDLVNELDAIIGKKVSSALSFTNFIIEIIFINTPALF